MGSRAGQSIDLCASSFGTDLKVSRHCPQTNKSSRIGGLAQELLNGPTGEFSVEGDSELDPDSSEGTEKKGETKLDIGKYLF